MGKLQLQKCRNYKGPTWGSWFCGGSCSFDSLAASTGLLLLLPPLLLNIGWPLSSYVRFSSFLSRYLRVFSFFTEGLVRLSSNR